MLKLLLFSTLVAGAFGACLDNGDKLINGLCFKLVNQPMTFEAARDWCHYQNSVTPSYLAYISSASTANFLSTYARTAFSTSTGSFWIGLSRNSSISSTWYWDNGKSLQFSNFQSNQGDFVSQSISNGKWDARKDTGPLPFVCSYDPAAPPTFPTQIPMSTPTMTPPSPTTTEEYDEFCNIGEKHSTFLFAYSADFDASSYGDMIPTIINAITANRHNYTKLARVKFDKKPMFAENITYYDDVDSFSDSLLNNYPNSPEPVTTPSNVFSVVSDFLAASGRPLESSMIILLVARFPDLNSDLTQTEWDVITNNNVKIFPIIHDVWYRREFPKTDRSLNPLTKLAANSNGNFLIGASRRQLNSTVQYLMETAYLDSLSITRNFVDNFSGTKTNIAQVRVPHSQTSNVVNFTVTISVETLAIDSTDTNGIRLNFYQNANSYQEVIFEPGSLYYSNYYHGTVQLKTDSVYQVFYTSSLNSGSIVMLRVWTESKSYHYGSYASLEDPMGGNTLSQVDEYQGAALRVKLMNDCYSEHAGYATFTDCAGTVSQKYDSKQVIPIDYIFADEGSFPHYPIVPFFCDSTPKSTKNCVPGTESKYDIQFVAGEFTVVRSFQCRPGAGKINSNCTNVDSNGNYYCNRNQLPYMRGPTGQIPDCLGHGYVEYDFANAETYICVCDDGYSGDSCEKKG